MASKRYYLIVRATGEARLTLRYPRLRSDEVAFPIVINFPSGWGQTQPTVEISLPEGVPTIGTIEDVELPDDDGCPNDDDEAQLPT